MSKELLTNSQDAYLCTCYIPPEDSNVYKNVKSPLHRFCFFDQLCIAVRNYSDRGNVYLTGDFNARTGEHQDYVPNIGLNRFVSTPDPVDIACSLPSRTNDDKLCNPFGLKLLTVCKENNLSILNGRLEKGHFTYHGLNRNKPVASTVDYLICNSDNYESVDNFCVCDISEFSDHCCIVFSLNVNKTMNTSTNPYEKKKIIWDNMHTEVFHANLFAKAGDFILLNDKLLSGDITINECMDGFSSLMHDISTKTYAKSTFDKSNKTKNVKPPWFNNECKLVKTAFYDAKRLFNCARTDENKTFTCA